MQNKSLKPPKEWTEKSVKPRTNIPQSKAGEGLLPTLTVDLLSNDRKIVKSLVGLIARAQQAKQKKPCTDSGLARTRVENPQALSYVRYYLQGLFEIIKKIKLKGTTIDLLKCSGTSNTDYPLHAISLSIQ